MFGIKNSLRAAAVAVTALTGAAAGTAVSSKPAEAQVYFNGQIGIVIGVPEPLYVVPRHRTYRTYRTYPAYNPYLSEEAYRWEQERRAYEWRLRNPPSPKAIAREQCQQIRKQTRNYSMNCSY
jgi:hypothetical protein